jgi:hypothetical protein
MEELKIIESSQLPLGEKVYLKKDFLGSNLSIAFGELHQKVLVRYIPLLKS